MYAKLDTSNTIVQMRFSPKLLPVKVSYHAGGLRKNIYRNKKRNVDIAQGGKSTPNNWSRLNICLMSGRVLYLHQWSKQESRIQTLVICVTPLVNCPTR